jgi:hypothetical protein
MFSKLKSEIINFIVGMQTVHNAMIVWNQTRSIEKTKAAMEQAR